MTNRLLRFSVSWALLCSASVSLFAADEIPPVRAGDKVQVMWFSKWYPGVVESYQDGKATVNYKRGSLDTTREVELNNLRFPDNEGHWDIWKDKSGNFRVEARYISRTKTDVTIRKADGSEITVSIANLHATLRKRIAKTPITSELTLPVHVGDMVEVMYFSKWHDGVVKAVQDQGASVEIKSDSPLARTRDFKLKDIRFPNGEGNWGIWKDASGDFKVEARYLSRTKTEVTLLKTDGSELTVPINKLHPSLRSRLAKTMITADLNKIDGAIPIRVGDRVQVKNHSSWYDGTVKAVKIGGAGVEYDLGTWGKKTANFEFKDVRYPNGEGPWREWSNSSASFKVIARYLARTETHVTILKEDRTEISIPIAKLSVPLRKRLKDTPVVARRPRLVSLAGAELIGDSPSAKLSTMDPVREQAEIRIKNRTRQQTNQMRAGPDLSSVSINVGTPVSQQTVRLPKGGVAVAIDPKTTLGRVVPIGGTHGWVALSTKATPREKQLTTLHWASLTNKKSIQGPSFYPDQRFLAYSAHQKRVVMYSVKGTWNEPYSLSTYRISPGETSAKSEITLDIPKMKDSWNREPVRAELIGDNMMLFGYAGKVSLWDLEERRVVYEVSGLTSHFFQLSIDHDYFAVRSGRTTISLHNLHTGNRLGQGTWEGYGNVTACFSHDGKRLTVATSSGFYRWDLAGNQPVEPLQIGGVGVSNNSPLADLSGGWLVAGPQIYSVGLELIVWRYDGGSRSRIAMAASRPFGGGAIRHQQMLGRQMLVAATTSGLKGSSILIGVATVPHEDAIEMMMKVDPNSVRMLVHGSRVKIDTSVDTRIQEGLRLAAKQNGWIEDSGAEAVLTGSAKTGDSQQLTYRTIRFGFGGSDEQTHSVTPWIQTAKIIYREKIAWSTSAGGVPYSVHLEKGQTLGGELQKAGNPSYALFQNLKIPEEIIYPRYQRGLGQTVLTPRGFVDEAY